MRAQLEAVRAEAAAVAARHESERKELEEIQQKLADAEGRLNEAYAELGLQDFSHRTGFQAEIERSASFSRSCFEAF